mgnify:FL=1
MATKSYKWFFDLTENLLTKDVTNDYIATVKTLLPKTVDNLADDIVKETAYNRETVIGVITLYDKKIIESVCQGNTVNTGSTLYAPALPGSFIGTDGVVDRTKPEAPSPIPILASALKLDLPNYAPEECPICKEGKLPLVHLGSRKMKQEAKQTL